MIQFPLDHWEPPCWEPCCSVWPPWQQGSFSSCLVWPSPALLCAVPILPPVPMITTQHHLLLPLLPLHHCRQQWCCHSASFSPDWTAHMSSVSPPWNVSSSPLNIFVMLLWTLSRTLASFPYCGTQNCTQFSKWGHISAKCSRRNTSFDETAVLCLMQPKIWFPL